MGDARFASEGAPDSGRIGPPSTPCAAASLGRRPSAATLRLRWKRAGDAPVGVELGVDVANGEADAGRVALDGGLWQRDARGVDVAQRKVHLAGEREESASG